MSNTEHQHGTRERPTQSTTASGSRVIAYRRRFDDPITAEERLEALEAAREDYIDRNGSAGADLVGSALPVSEQADDSDDKQVAFVCAISPDGVPILYGGTVAEPESVNETAVEATSYAERFAALTETDITVSEPDGSTRDVEIGNLNDVPGLDETNEATTDVSVGDSLAAQPSPRLSGTSYGADLNHQENMSRFAHSIKSHKSKPYGAIYRDMKWYRGVKHGQTAHAILSDLSVIPGQHKYHSWYGNRHSHITHHWNKAEPDDVQIIDWGPKGTQTGEVSREVSVGGSVGSQGGSMNVGASWSYTQPDVHEKDKSEPEDLKTKWKLNVLYNTDPRDSTVNYDPLSMCKMNTPESGSGWTRIFQESNSAYWTSSSSFYGHRTTKRWNWYLKR